MCLLPRCPHRQEVRGVSSQRATEDNRSPDSPLCGGGPWGGVGGGGLLPEAPSSEAPGGRHATCWPPGARGPRGLWRHLVSSHSRKDSAWGLEVAGER